MRNADSPERTFFTCAAEAALNRFGRPEPKPSEESCDLDMPSVLGKDGSEFVGFLRDLQDRGIGFSLLPLQWSEDFMGVVIPMKFAGSDGTSNIVTVYREHTVIEGNLLTVGTGVRNDRLPTWHRGLYGDIAEIAIVQFGPEKVARMMALYGPRVEG